jgi:hypothetical protein
VSREKPFSGAPKNTRKAKNVSKEIQKSLGIIPGLKLSDPHSTISQAPSRRKQRAGEDAFDFANQMDIAQSAHLDSFSDAIWAKLNAALIYPEVFVRQRIQGKVQIQVSVNSQGVLVGKLYKVSGSDPRLNAFVFATVLHTLSTALPKESWMKTEKEAFLKEIPLALHFEFKLFGPGTFPKKPEFSHLKNIFHFCKNSYADNAVNHAVNQLKDYLPPIIPIPGGVFIDFIQAYRLIYQLSTNPPSQDQRDANFMKLNQEKWKSVIQRKSDSI